MVSSVCMWMNDVAAAWVMTTIAASPNMVALVQTASSLPIFLLGLPSGALADIFDRRKVLIVTRVWAAATALLSSITLAFGHMTAPLLLVLTFANGMARAMRWPVSSAMVPATVPRVMLQGALALNSVAFNSSRIVGPLLAGAVIASAGSVYVFAINALLSATTTVVVLRWKRPPDPPRAGPKEQLGGAILAGLRYVRQSDRLRAILLRMSLFFLHATALVALLPVVARDMHGASAASFTLLLAAMGCGAVVSLVYVLPRARLSMPSDILLGGGTLLMSVAMVVVAIAPNLTLAIGAMVAAGMAWTTVANSLTVLSQLALPDWVRARGMSIQLVCMMGSSAAGAALWGQIATSTSVVTSLCLAAASAAVWLFVLRKQRLGNAFAEEAAQSDPL